MNMANKIIILLKTFLHIVLIPFLVSIPGVIFGLSGLSKANIFVIPALAAVIYIVFRKIIDGRFAAKVNGIAALVLLLCFTVMMLFAKGNVEGVIMANFSWLIFPFTPIMLVYMLMGQNMILYSTAILTYIVAFLVTAVTGKIATKKYVVPTALGVGCIVISLFLYTNRPAVKYGGHGFKYMHGYSSTDFSDYMVYSENSKLVILETAPSLMIEKEEDMPKMDGAEACYPLYAAFAKAVYKDIDVIEKEWLNKTENPYVNGKYVSFTNSISGYTRLVFGEEDTRNSDYSVDMFFGAQPSMSQFDEADDLSVELAITVIGREGFVFFVEEDNPVDNLSSEQVKAIYHGDITNWKELGGKNREILAFQRPRSSGSQTMMEYFMGDTSLKEPQTYEKVDAMAGVIKEVAQYSNNKGAIGYSFRYFLEELNQEKGVKMLSIDGVYPSLENIENGTYPLVTNVCLITRKNETNPYVQKMIDFILSDEGQEIVRKTGYAGVNVWQK